MNPLKAIGKVMTHIAGTAIGIAAVPVVLAIQVIQKARGKKGFWDE